MAEAKLGTLAARVVIDRGRRPHYGPEDIITGKFIVSYQPYKSTFRKNVTTADYFGPLKLEATLRGKVRVKIKRSRDTVISSDYGTRLFMQHFEVFNGSFKAEVGQDFEFPFAVPFPASIGGSPTPPSFSIYFSDYPDRVDAAVVYRLGVKIDTPGIKVETSTPDFNPEPEVMYDLPVQSTIDVSGSTLRQKIVIQNKHLLPEAERPSGLKQNLKAAFSSSSFPIFAANITCTHGIHAYSGHRPRFHFAVRVIESETTAMTYPAVILDSFKITLVAHTEVDTSERVMASSSCYDSRTAQKLSPVHSDTDLPATLSKANDYSVEVEMEPFAGHPSSFTHPKISRKYHIEIKGELRIAESSVVFRKQYPVQFLPSPARSGNAPSYLSQPGPSRMSASMSTHPNDGAAAAGAGPSQVSMHEEMEPPPPAYDATEPGDGATVRHEKG